MVSNVIAIIVTVVCNLSFLLRPQNRESLSAIRSCGVCHCFRVEFLIRSQRENMKSVASETIQNELKPKLQSAKKLPKIYRFPRHRRRRVAVVVDGVITVVAVEAQREEKTSRSSVAQYIFASVVFIRKCHNFTFISFCSVCRLYVFGWFFLRQRYLVFTEFVVGIVVPLWL